MVHKYIVFVVQTIALTTNLLSCINDRPGSMCIGNGYYNENYGLHGKYLLKIALILLVMTYWLHQNGFQ